MKLLLVLAAIATLGATAGLAPLTGDALAGRALQAQAIACAPLRPPPRPAAGQTTMYGHIRSLIRQGGRFEMRFDPAWWLTGVPAERAAVEDKAIRPGEPVPNDYYIVDEGHRLLTFTVPADARVTVLPGGRPCTTRTTVGKLAAIVRRGDARLGFWIRITATYPSPVVSLDQQYQP